MFIINFILLDDIIIQHIIITTELYIYIYIIERIRLVTVENFFDDRREMRLSVLIYKLFGKVHVCLYIRMACRLSPAKLLT